MIWLPASTRSASSRGRRIAQGALAKNGHARSRHQSGRDVRAFGRQTRRGPVPLAQERGTYRPWSWQRAGTEARLLARWLAARGIAPGERILILSENRPEWCVADLAILMAGGVTVPAYTTSTSDDLAYLLAHAEVAGVICSGQRIGNATVARARPVSDGAVSAPDGGGDLGDAAVPTATWPAPWPKARSAPDLDIGTRLRGDDLACFIYTSGTGGRPKGVMLTHDNILANLRGAWGLLERIGLGDEVFLSFLPLSHAYEHTAGPIPADRDGRADLLRRGCRHARGQSDRSEADDPHLRAAPLRGAPPANRRGREAAGWPLRERLFNMAVDLGRQRYLDGRLPLHLAAADLLLDRLVRAKVQERFGGRLKAMVSGGAPLNLDVGHVLPCARPARSAGLRPDRGVTGDQRQRPRACQTRYRRAPR